MEMELELFGKMILAIEKLENCREFSRLIPEVRSNLVYSKPNPKGPEDVLGVEGRITVVNGKPYAVGRPKFGASSHMARLIVELNKIDPSIRSGINFSVDEHLADWLRDYCNSRGWVFSVIDRSREPEEFKKEEGASMPWKVSEAIRAAGGSVPKVFYETGAVGKEDVAVIVGKDPIEVVDEACRIAELYVSREEKIGKIDPDTFESIVLRRLGKWNDRILVPPKSGVDGAIIDLGGGKVLAIAEDPIFSIPKQPPEMFGWYTVHIGASDVAVMGVKPEYMCYTLLMPPETKKEEFERIVNSIHEAALELGISIIGGHTGYYPGFASPTIGGVTVFGITEKGKYVTPEGAEPGNDVILTKGPAIEAVGILSVLREEELLRELPEKTVERAKSLCKQMTVVKDALTAMETGGVTAMHDATEGGVIGGLFELSQASNVGIEVDESQMIYPEEVRAVCDFFGIDPLEAISEGSLIITSEEEYSDEIIRNLKKEGINASVIGKITEEKNKKIIKRLNGKISEIKMPEKDPFWGVFFEGMKRLY